MIRRKRRGPRRKASPSSVKLRQHAPRTSSDDSIARLSAVLESLNDAVIGATRDGVIKSWNRGAEAIYGYLAEEAVGRHFSMLVPPERADEVPQFLERIQKGDVVRDYETVRLKKDGSPIYVSITQAPIRDSAGDVIGFTTIARDMSDRIRAEEAIVEGAQRFRNLVEDLPIAIFRTAADGRITEVNPACVEMLGYPSKRALVNRNSAEFYADREDFDKYTRAIREKGVLVGIQTRVRRADGKVIWALGTARTLQDVEGGPVVGYLGIFADITERVERESATKQLSMFQELVIRILGHDLKAPIGVIQGYLELAGGQLEAPLDPMVLARVRDDLHKAAEAASSMLVLLANARAISRLTMSPKEAPPGEVIDLGRMVLDVVGMLKPLAEAKRLQFRVEAREGLRAPVVPGFESVISNLTTNAIKYTPPAGAVDVSLREEKGRVVLTVEDTGPGIPVEMRPRLFRKFERLAQEQSVGSHGLGLSIAASLVEISGGTIGVSDRPDGRPGTVFQVEIPTGSTARR